MLKNSNLETLSLSSKKTALTDRIVKYNSLLVLLSLVLALCIWSAVVRWGDLPAFVLPAPGAVWRKFLQTLQEGTLLKNTLATLAEVLLGLLAGATLAMILGYLLAKSNTLEKIISPFLVASQAVPTVAIAPLLIIWFGSGMGSKVLICGLTVFFPILVNTILGFRSVPADLTDLMRSLHPNRWQMFKYLEIPAALPILFGGLRIGATLSVIGAVVGEFVGSDQGLGFLINVGRGQYDMPLVFVSLFTLIFLALLLYGLMVSLERLSTPWKKTADRRK